MFLIYNEIFKETFRHLPPYCDWLIPPTLIEISQSGTRNSLHATGMYQNHNFILVSALKCTNKILNTGIYSDEDKCQLKIRLKELSNNFKKPDSRPTFNPNHFH